MGDSPDQFYLALKGAGDLPIQCDAAGLTSPDAQGVQPPSPRSRTPRDASRPGGPVPRLRLRRGEPPGTRAESRRHRHFRAKADGQLITAKLLDVHWTVYLANKKASWYRLGLDGEHGYPQATRSAIRR